MKVTFIGTGEACDPNRRNTSVLLREKNSLHLFDCGFSASHGFFSQDNLNSLSTIWISHLHGDHFFGIPHIIVHFYQQKRNSPLTICSGSDCREQVIASINLAYPRLAEKLDFPLIFVTLPPGEPIKCNDLIWQSAPVSHSPDAFGIRVTTGDYSLYYSGDGKPTLQAVKLIKGCTLVIHEAYSRLPTNPAHFSIEECLLLAEELHLHNLAIVHCNRSTREFLQTATENLAVPTGTKLYIPEDGDCITL